MSKSDYDTRRPLIQKFVISLLLGLPVSSLFFLTAMLGENSLFYSILGAAVLVSWGIAGVCNYLFVLTLTRYLYQMREYREPGTPNRQRRAPAVIFDPLANFLYDEIERVEAGKRAMWSDIKGGLGKALSKSKKKEEIEEFNIS